MRQETQSFRCDIQAFQFLKEEIGIFLIFYFLEFIIFFYTNTTYTQLINRFCRVWKKIGWTNLQLHVGKQITQNISRLICVSSFTFCILIWQPRFCI